MTDKLKELITADFFLQHETKYTQRWDHVEDHDDCYTWECSCGAIEESKFHSWEECHLQTRRHWAEKLIALLAEPAPAGESASPKPENVKWLIDASNQVISELGKQEHLDSDTFRWLCNAVGQVERDLRRSSQPAEQRDPAGK